MDRAVPSPTPADSAEVPFTHRIASRDRNELDIDDGRMFGNRSVRLVNLERIFESTECDLTRGMLSGVRDNSVQKGRHQISSLPSESRNFPCFRGIYTASLIGLVIPR